MTSQFKNSGVTIRLAKTEHAGQIAALHAASWAATYGDVLSPHYLQQVVPMERRAIWQERFKNPRPNQFTLMAEEAGVVVGFACVFVAEHTDWGSYLDNLHVKPSHQGLGVGRGLLFEAASLCEQTCPGRGLYLLVNQSNLRAQRFYQALGAENAQAAIWNAPDGSCVPTFRFAWASAAMLAKNWLPHHSSPER